MSVAVARPNSTTGFLCMWNGTKDGERGYVDYSSGKTNVNEPMRVNIVAHNMRTMETKPTLGGHGYELASEPSSLSTEEMLAGNTPEGRKVIEERYYAECKAIIQKMTGCKIVVPYVFRIRQNGTNPKEFGSKSVTNSSMTAKSLPIAHVDRDRMTLEDGIREAFGDEAPALMAQHKRWAQINVWRGIDSSVQKWPLVFINHSQVAGWDYDTHMETVLPINDPRVAIRGHKAQDCVLKHDPGYEYHYASDMTRDEVLVFSSGDSDPAKVVPHGAFWDDMTAEDAPTRRSLEVRSWVFFED
ncbi:hypothetical protein B0I35DRAFT_476254 [Stachybotrys elegans]|uniref:Uncharacterized protein n=1 Tax=Stachybotrys elegans TaxID=80388 RepID=A0A8K0SYC6_9HYPO|nr:hypothetical protein B0I35DRAFT_476254 [Stachybotrys elegans]